MEIHINNKSPNISVNQQSNSDYYIENGYKVFKPEFHIKRGYCCGNGCRHCPYHPQHMKGTQTLR